MSDREQLWSWFDSGTLVRPRAAEVPTSVDLIRALTFLCGATDLNLSPQAQDLVQRIGPARHYVLAIVDGLGLELLQQQLQSGFLLDHLKTRLEAVFPSTTGAAMTSIATGVYPGEHGVPVWWVWLDEHNLSIVSLPFVERLTGRALMAF